MLKSSILVEIMSKNGQIIKNNPDFYINFSLYDFLQPKVEEIGQKSKKIFFFRNMKIFSKKKFTQKFPKKIPSISKVSDYWFHEINVFGKLWFRYLNLLAPFDEIIFSNYNLCYSIENGVFLKKLKICHFYCCLSNFWR